MFEVLREVSQLRLFVCFFAQSNYIQLSLIEKECLINTILNEDEIGTSDFHFECHFGV